MAHKSPLHRALSTPLGSRHSEAVERAETYARARTGESVRLAELCRIVGLSERGLRNAFYDVRGLSPMQCLVRGRLHDVRRKLRDGGAPEVTVTDVATAYGFYELGRFARTYRMLFGETPSATLRAACAAANRSSATTKGHLHACAD